MLAGPVTILDRIEQTRYSTKMPGPESEKHPEKIPEAPRTLPAGPLAIARELEPVIERATHGAATLILERLEGRLAKIEHALEIAAKHDAILLQEVMDIKLRVDKLETRVSKVEAHHTLFGARGEKTAGKFVVRKKARRK